MASGAPVWLMALAGACAAPSALPPAILMVMRRRGAALVAAMLTALIFYPTLMWGVAPRLEKIWVSPRLAALVAKDKRPGDPPVVTSGYDEPSLIFLLGTDDAHRHGAGEAAEIAAAQWRPCPDRANASDAVFLHPAGRTGRQCAARSISCRESIIPMASRCTSRSIA